MNVEFQNVEHRVLETKESFKWYLTLIPTFKIETIPHFQSPETYLRGKSNSIVVISTM